MTESSYLRSSRGYSLPWYILYAHLGLNPKRHLPAEGLSSQMVGNVEVWVVSKPTAELAALVGRQSFIHRVRCSCPDCFQQLSAGRLQQHLKACPSHQDKVKAALAAVDKASILSDHRVQSYLQQKGELP